MSSSCARLELLPEKSAMVWRKGVSEGSGGNIELRFQEGFTTRLAEFLLRGVFGLEDAAAE